MPFPLKYPHFAGDFFRTISTPAAAGAPFLKYPHLQVPFLLKYHLHAGVPFLKYPHLQVHLFIKYPLPAGAPFLK